MIHESDAIDFTGGLLAECAERIFAELCTKDVIDRAEAGEWPEALWNALEEAGLTRAAIPEAAGGSGLPLPEVLQLVRLAARHTLPLPFGETVVAAWLLAQANLDVPAGPLAFAPVDRQSRPLLRPVAGGWRLDGRLRNLPWGERVKRVVLVANTDEGCKLASVDPIAARCTPGTNLAGEPRVRLDFTAALIDAANVVPAPEGVDAGMPYLYGALLRGQQMAGALQLARDLTVRYTGERIAFGKPLNQLQAVQQNLAVLAGQSAAATVAADMALAALRNPQSDTNSTVALSKIRINEAAEIGARLAHQAHGAFGFTYEHRLHLATRRLWSWRDEFGNDAWWAEQVGRSLIEAGPNNFWTTLTRMAEL